MVHLTSTNIHCYTPGQRSLRYKFQIRVSAGTPSVVYDGVPEVSLGVSSSAKGKPLTLYIYIYSTSLVVDSTLPSAEVPEFP